MTNKLNLSNPEDLIQFRKYLRRFVRGMRIEKLDIIEKALKSRYGKDFSGLAPVVDNSKKGTARELYD